MASIATLNLTKVWVNLLATGATVSAQSGPDRGRQHDQAGEVRTYAGGRQRSITTAGERGQFTVTLVDVSLTTVELLRGWIGQPVQLRDHRGQRFFGVFYAVNVIEAKDPVYYNVAIDLRTLTVAEGV